MSVHQVDVSLQTKENLENEITDPMVVGQERCRACGWQNILWADDPRPMLIASIRLSRGYVCPACRHDGDASRFTFGPIAYSEWFGEAYQTKAEVAAESLTATETRVTFCRHVRAAVRLLLPDDADGRSLFVGGIVAQIFLIGVVSIAKLDWSYFVGALSIPLWFIGLYELFHFVPILFVALLGLVMASDRPAALSELQSTWFEYGEDRLGHRH